MLCSFAHATDRYVAVDGGGSDDGSCTNSENPCVTIQHAVTNATGGDTIYVAAGTYNESISILKTITLIGEARSTTIIDGQSTNYCLESDSPPSSITVTIRKFTIQNCEHVNTGAAVYVVGDFSSPSLVIEDVYFYNNFISTDSGFGPGAVYFGSGNSLTMNRVTFDSNHGPKGAAVFIASSTSATLTNVTFINNSTSENPTDSGAYNSDQGGAVWTNSNTTINNSTFYNNISTNGNAIYRSFNTVTVKNSILTGTGNDCSGTVTSGGYNLVSDTSCSFSETGDVESVTDMGLLSLADNGGEVQTMSLDEDSPALDAGDNDSCSSEDARGESRPADGDYDSTATCDIGAFEVICGDNIVDGMEECDSGDDNSDENANACRLDCIDYSCGDSVVDSLEACDDGNDSNSDSCLNTCAAATCGDGILQSGEEDCDDGDENSDELANACRSTCVFASCGDGVVDDDEECDDGNSNNNDDCSNLCEEIVIEEEEEENLCGNGTVDEGEECDDENTDNVDGCSASCALETYDGLTASNQGIDFSNLTTGETITLNFPDSSPSTSRSSALLFSQSSSSSCTCAWAVTPSSFADIDDATSCTPSMTISGSDQANLGVSVECEGAEAISANQTLIVASTSEIDATGGAGCQLQSQNTPELDHNKKPMLLLLIVLMASILKMRFWTSRD